MAVTEAPVTLEEVKRMMDDEWRRGITDDFQRNSFFSRHLTYHSLTNPITGGSGTTHKFTRLENTAKAHLRRVNESVDDTRVATLNEMVETKIFTSIFRIDRVLDQMGTLAPETLLQISECAKAVSRKFEEMCILGDSSTNPLEFDGIYKIAQSYGRIEDAGTIDIHDPVAVNQSKDTFIWKLDEWLSTFDEKPTFLAGNARMITCLKGVARAVGVYQTTTDQWGHQVASYDGIPLIDMGWKADQKLNVSGNTYRFTQEPIIPTNTTTGTSYLIAGRFGMDSIYGICPSIGSLLKYWHPDFTSNAFPVQPGSVEMQAAIVVNKIQSIGILDKIKIAKTAQPELKNTGGSKK